jgi:hypothetical protein
MADLFDWNDWRVIEEMKYYKGKFTVMELKKEQNRVLNSTKMPLKQKVNRLVELRELLKEKLMKTTTVTQCIFKRTQISKEERGIAIGNCDLIIDKNLKPVTTEVWSYILLWNEGTLPVEL